MGKTLSLEAIERSIVLELLSDEHLNGEEALATPCAGHPGDLGTVWI